GQTPCARLSRVPWGQTDRPEHNRRQVMIESHSGALLVGYATALLGWLLLSRAAPSLWPQRAPIRFARPWLEVAVSLLAVVAVLAIGQLYIRGWLLPEAGSLKPLLAALNQILIYMPVLLVSWIRGQSAETLWLPRERLGSRLAAGAALGLAA